MVSVAELVRQIEAHEEDAGWDQMPQVYITSGTVDDCVVRTIAVTPDVHLSQLIAATQQDISRIKEEHGDIPAVITSFEAWSYSKETEAGVEQAVKHWLEENPDWKPELSYEQRKTEKWTRALKGLFQVMPPATFPDRVEERLVIGACADGRMYQVRRKRGEEPKFQELESESMHGRIGAALKEFLEAAR